MWKPGAINSGILKQIEAEAAKTGCLVRIGFNRRDHPAFQKAYALVREEALGPPMFIRGRYGHAGTIGLQNEWPGQLGAGGNLLHMGIHLSHLAFSVMVGFTSLAGHLLFYFRKIPVDYIAFLHICIT